MKIKVFSRNVSITLSYRESDIAGMDPDTLTIGRFDENKKAWILLPSIVDRKNRRVIGQTNHFSRFQLLGVVPANNVNQVKAFPNPLRTHRGQKQMTFTTMSAFASVKIYTYSGELVREMTADARGIAEWDARNSEGAEVSSGGYLALVEGAQNSRKVLIIAVER